MGKRKKKKVYAEIENRPRDFVYKHMNEVNHGGAHRDKTKYNRKEKHRKRDAFSILTSLLSVFYNVYSRTVKEKRWQQSVKFL